VTAAVRASLIGKNGVGRRCPTSRGRVPYLGGEVGRKKPRISAALSYLPNLSYRFGENRDATTRRSAGLERVIDLSRSNKNSHPEISRATLKVTTRR
jgi:hypothetical protein